MEMPVQSIVSKVDDDLYRAFFDTFSRRPIGEETMDMWQMLLTICIQTQKGVVRRRLARIEKAEGDVAKVKESTLQFLTEWPDTNAAAQI